jgi:hypothetical protein
VYILIVEAIERQKTGVEYAEGNGITTHLMPTNGDWWCPHGSYCGGGK